MLQVIVRAKLLNHLRASLHAKVRALPRLQQELR
jgi:hypothetical protein